VAVEADAGRVYATDDAPRDGEVTALSTDGDEQWSTSGPAHLGTPVVAGDRVYALGEDALLALDATDGSVAWRRGGPPGHGGGLAVADGRVYAAAGGGTVALAREADTGAPVTPPGTDEDEGEPWRVRTGGGEAAPVVAGGTVLVPGARGLFAVDARTGERRWRRERLGGRPARAVAVADGRAYVGGSDGVAALR
jgi:outer membrane protein assembly factor BamB